MQNIHIMTDKYNCSQIKSIIRSVRSLGDNGATNHHHHYRQRHQLQIALARVLDVLGPKRKHF